tara:strand:+ start:69 stop:794 length:726 start_codon:yes stop_codon:yes gene_type:complete
MNQPLNIRRSEAPWSTLSDKEKRLLLKISSISWFHHFDKETFGFHTNGEKGEKNKVEAEAWGFDTNLFKGKSVLDIGAWDGYFSFWAEKMGAKRVLATDYCCWAEEAKYWGTQDGFNLAYDIIGSKIESKKIDVPDISIETVGKFDVVLFLGVFYHLPNPILGLQRAAEVTGDTLVIETAYEKTEGGALLELFPKNLRGDPTNYWSPNIKCLKFLLIEFLGFKKVRFRNVSDRRLTCFAYK